MNLYKVENKVQHIRQLGVTLFILNILDIIFTKIAFMMGSNELNPFLLVLFNKIGFIGGILLPKIFIAFIILYISYKFNLKNNYKFYRNALYIGIIPYLMLIEYHIINFIFFII